MAAGASAAPGRYRARRRGPRTYGIPAPVVADYACVEACPAGCIHPAPDESGFEEAEQLYIDPRTCIDCAACLEACPVDAIHAGDRLPVGWEHYAAVNADFFAATTAPPEDTRV